MTHQDESAAPATIYDRAAFPAVRQIGCYNIIAYTLMGSLRMVMLHVFADSDD